MKKILIMGLLAFSLMATTVYALNDNSGNDDFVNEPITYNQNCPYHNGNEDCPYYDETNNTSDCPNNENGSCQHNHGHHGNGYGKHGGCSHHNR